MKRPKRIRTPLPLPKLDYVVKTDGSESKAKANLSLNIKGDVAVARADDLSIDLLEIAGLEGSHETRLPPVNMSFKIERREVKGPGKILSVAVTTSSEALMQPGIDDMTVLPAYKAGGFDGSGHKDDIAEDDRGLVAAVKEMKDKRFNNRDIASCLHLSETKLHRLLEEAGFIAKKRRSRLSPSDLGIARAMHSAGATADQIGRALSRSPAFIRAELQKLVLKL